MNESDLNKQKYMPLISAANMEFGLQENLLFEVLSKESSFRTDIISGQKLSPKGARGFGQFTAGTGIHYAQLLNIPLEFMWEPQNQIRMSAAYLKDLYGMYKKDSQLTPENKIIFTKASYNAGPFNRDVKAALHAAKTGIEFLSLLPAETQKYVSNFAVARVTPLPKPIDPNIPPTKRFFNQLGDLNTNLTKMNQLPESKFQKFANFLKAVGKGKIISIK